MIRGTTPTHLFRLPFDTSRIREIRILYAQGGQLVLEKTGADCVMEENTVSVTLSQEETLQFSHRETVDCQIRVLTMDGTAFANQVFHLPVDMVLSEEVLQ